MAAGPIQYFNAWKDWAFSAGVDLDNGLVQVALCTAGLTPDPATHTVFADVSGFELSHPSYPAGGVVLANPAVVVTGSAGKFTSDDPILSLVGPDSAAKWGIFYYNGAPGAFLHPLIAYVDLNTGGGAQALPAGYQFKLTMPAGGWLTWS